MKRKIVIASVLGLLLLGTVVALLPSVFMQSSVRRWIIADLLKQQGIDAEIESVSLGWFKPVRVEGVSIGPVGEPTLLKASGISSDRTLWKAITEGVELGRLSIDAPEIHVWLREGSSNLQFPKLETALEEAPSEPASTSNSDSTEKTLRIKVNKASLFVKTPTMTEETAVFRDVDLDAAILQNNEGRSLLIEPGRILDHAQISPELCEGGLKYVVPMLAEATWTRGEFSIDLDACVIDLDNPDQSLVSGTLHVHGVEAGIRNQLLAVATKSIVGAMGRDNLDSIHLADDSEIHFQIRDGMVWHDGVEFGLPRVSEDLVVRTSGSVAFDERMDLDIDIPMPLHLVADGPLAQALTDKSLTLKAKGTLSNPEVDVNDGDLVGRLVQELGQQFADGERPVAGILKGIREVIGGGRQDGPTAAADLSPEDERELGDDREPGDESELGNDLDAILEAGGPLLDRLRDRLETPRTERRRLFRRRGPADVQ